MHTRTGSFRLAILSVALTALLGTQADRCVPEPQGKQHREVCPQGWAKTSSRDICQKFFSTRQSWPHARKECQKEGADLVRIYDKDMIDMLIDHNYYVQGKMHIIDEYWIALTYSTSANEFTWPGENEKPKYEPYSWKIQDIDHHCTTAINNVPEWISQPCDSNKSFTCEMVKPGKGCPRGWNSLGSLNWCITKVSEASYTEASTLCSSSGATVATLKSAEKYDAYYAYLSGTWFGATDQESEGHFVWTSGASVPEAYARGIDKNGGTRENCLAIDVRHGYWFDVDCSMELPFVCQKPSAGAMSAPVMEMKPRYTDVSGGSQARKQNVYFVGEQVYATCRALRVPTGKIAWTMWTLDYTSFSGFQVLQDLDNFVNNTVETILHENACVNQTVSTFSTTAAKNLTYAYLSCYSYKKGTYPHCTGFGDPLEYCVNSFDIKVIDAPYKEPDLQIAFSKPPSTMTEGDRLVAHCQVYPLVHDSLVWVIFPASGGSRALQYNVDPEIVSENSTDTGGKMVIASRLEMTVEKSFDGSRVACFSYDVSKSESHECRASDQFCAISPTIHVEGDPNTDALWSYEYYYYILLGVLLLLLLLILCLATSLKKRAKTEFVEGEAEFEYQEEDEQFDSDPPAKRIAAKPKARKKDTARSEASATGAQYEEEEQFDSDGPGRWIATKPKPRKKEAARSEVSATSSTRKGK